MEGAGRSLDLYPNPTSNATITVEIESPRATTASIRFVSARGEELLRRDRIALTAGSTVVALPLPTIDASGVYQLLVETPDGTITAPLVIHR